MRPLSILVFPGSIRSGAYSGKLAQAVGLAISDRGDNATVVDLRKFEAPIYNADHQVEQGIPETMLAFGDLIVSHDGIVIATPEYNGFFTPLTKNMLDWCSRIGRGTDGAAIKRGKPACIVSSSGGALGGLRAVPRLRDYLNELGFLVAPDSASIGRADEAFAEDGRLLKPAQVERLDVVVERFLTLVRSVETST